MCWTNAAARSRRRSWRSACGSWTTAAAAAPASLWGGAYGQDDAVRRRAWKCLSLSAMTFPHELARVLLLEQIYRAECILRNVPYHH